MITAQLIVLTSDVNTMACVSPLPPRGRRHISGVSRYFPWKSTPMKSQSVNDAATPAAATVIANRAQFIVALLRGWLLLFFFLVEHGGGGDRILLVQSEQAHALRRAAGFADFVGVDADNLPVLGDDHHVGLFGHLERRDHGAVTVGGLQVDDALAAARGDAVFRERRALTEALLRDGQHQRGERVFDVLAF